MARSFFCSQAGEGPFCTPRISRPAKTGQAPCATSSAIVTWIGEGNRPATASIAGVFSRPSPRAARSRATPVTPSASGRLGVMAMSKTGSFSPA